ncbi:MAG: hypothetical protein M1839_002661 [Geoglossum umbratile]|nr:MAG: hypothetical protein M1839_002661 [Geoglossum umbratile]
MLIVILILTDVVFFSIIFLRFDDATGVDKRTLDKAQPWLTCLALTGGDKNRCLPLVKKLVVGEVSVVAVLILLSMNGVWCMIFFARWGMITGWIELFKGKLRRGPEEFVSLDAGRFSRDPRTYEMLSPGLKSPETVITSSSVESDIEQVHPSRGSKPSYPFGREVEHAPPAPSSSLPSSLTRQVRAWDGTTTNARGTMFPGMRNSN